MKPKTSAFTLIELLTVIAIIAVLMALLFPIMGTVKTAANKASARNDMVSIKGAVTGYYSDYGNYPINSYQNWDAATNHIDTMFGDPGGSYSNDKLFNVLRAKPLGENADNALNPKQVVYLEGKPAKAQNTAKPLNGFADDATGDAKGRYFDPWGNQYVVWVDANGSGYTNLWGFYYDDSVHMDPHTGSESDGYYVQANTASASLGKDGQWGTAGNKKYKGSDDVVSWE
jgi:prepilin-type N-terminal cleavage/methylation domain-containing protein